MNSRYVGTLLFFLALYASQAGAVLGGSINTIDDDQKALSAIRHPASSRPSYTVEEFSNNAMTLREYVSNGKVFAVTWRGIGHPSNMRALLGEFVTDFDSAIRDSARPRRLGRASHRVIKGSRVVVQTSGHLRALRGLAYAPELVPAGVNVNELN